MHISEGVLSWPVLAGGAALGVSGVVIGLRRLDYEKLVSAAFVASAFFVASLIHVPVGPSSAHLILNGFVAVLLGWAAFPAIFTALLLQAVLFSYGGITVLGLNTFNMAFPAVLCSLLFFPLLARPGMRRAAGAFCCGAFSVAGAVLLTALSLSWTNEGFALSAKILFVAHIPVMLAEGVLTVLMFSFVHKVRPDILKFF
ncbi:MAG: cobalt transporter CbiM [Deltaproteobacteria bacterium]|jgi:cobalt/nickel transport system permease protein|nr:cobalt transporter CbiM [Deltaproteobacteria bacterium]